ncbi:MAG: Bcr/CflA family efflux MFS transporter [Sphingomonas fennica]
MASTSSTYPPESSAAGGPPILRTGIVLGLLSLVGSLAIDLYLPAFPTIGRELGASAAEVQRSLSVFFLALAAAQIPWGSLGDRFGRKRPLYAGLLIFLIGTAGCATARDPGTLILFRFLQGFGVCAGTAISRAMIRDFYTGHRAARLLALSYLIIGISPVLAPLAGSLLLQAGGWRMLFWLLGAMGVAGILLAATAIPESLPPARRRPIHPRALLATYGALLANPRFVAAAGAAGLATTTPFAFLTAAPFLFAAGYGLTPMAYSLLLGLAAVCSIATTQVSPNLMRRYGPKRLLRSTTAASLGLSLLLAGLATAGALPLWLFQIVIMALFALVGLTLTPAAVTALDAAEAAGAAAALLGTMQLAISALASAAITIFAATTPVPLSLLLAAVWLAASLCAYVAFRAPIAA